MSLNLRESARTAMADGIISDAGTNAILKIFGGTRPAAGGSETTLLAEMAFSGALGTATAGVLNFNVSGLSDSSANADGTATWARIETSANAWVMDMDVGVGSGELQLDSAAIELGGTVTITASSLTMPNA